MLPLCEEMSGHSRHCFRLMTGFLAMASWYRTSWKPRRSTVRPHRRTMANATSQRSRQNGPHLDVTSERAQICLNQRTFPGRILSNVPCRPINGRLGFFGFNQRTSQRPFAFNEISGLSRPIMLAHDRIWNDVVKNSIKHKVSAI